VERFVLDNPVLTKLVDTEELKSLPIEERRRAIERIAEGLRQIAVSSARYRCSNCGYSTQRFIWHCPSCKLWETVRPIQSLPLENILA
jgi:lipopolysaccharide biosynthesis regulator YciM